MWPARSAIRPVPSHAVVPREAVDLVEAELGDAGDLETRIHQGLRDMEIAQPEVARYLRHEVESSKDETARALGQFLGVVVLHSFVTAFGQRVRRVEESALATVRATFDWDEELRRGAADEVLESDDLVAIGQPHLVSFVREQLEAALEPDEDGDAPDVDLDAVSLIYRVVLIEILVLGQAVSPPRGVTTTEILM
jgi:hypothetical protein